MRYVLFVIVFQVVESFFLKSPHFDYQNNIVQKFSAGLHPSREQARHTRTRAMLVLCISQFTGVCEVSQNYLGIFNYIF